MDSVLVGWDVPCVSLGSICSVVLFSSTVAFMILWMMRPSLRVQYSCPQCCIFNIVNVTCIKFCFIYSVALMLGAYM